MVPWRFINGVLTVDEWCLNGRLMLPCRSTVSCQSVVNRHLIPKPDLITNVFNMIFTSSYSNRDIVVISFDRVIDSACRRHAPAVTRATPALHLLHTVRLPAPFLFTCPWPPRGWTDNAVCSSVPISPAGMQDTREQLPVRRLSYRSMAARLPYFCLFRLSPSCN